MSKGDSDPPPAPDPAATVAAQAKANRVSQFTPGGNLLYGTTNDQGGFTQDPAGGAALYVEETPFQQAMRQRLQGAATNITNDIAAHTTPGYVPQIDLSRVPHRVTGLDTSGLSAVPTSDSFSDDAKRVEQATYDRALNLIRPDLDQKKRDLTQALADQGLPINSEAYNKEMDRYQQAEGQVLNDAALRAVDAGRQEQSRLFNQAIAGRNQGISEQLQNANLVSNARTGYLGEQQAQRSQLMSELAAVLGGSFNPTPTSAFTPPGQIDVTGPTSLAYQGQLAGFNARNQNAASFNNGLFGLGSAALLALL